MRNPVKLPSGYVVDRSSIERHLLNDPRDPFTKSPMRIEDVEVDLETKRKVEEWVQSKLSMRP
jgi:ubiquitin conjugation factor E4 B